MPSRGQLAAWSVGGLIWGVQCIVLGALLGIPNDWRFFLLMSLAPFFYGIANAVQKALAVRWTKECKP